MLIVEHKIEAIADFVDRVVLFDDAGGIIADGDPETVFRAHKSELIEFGIWYPGVWDDYTTTDGYRELMAARLSSAEQVQDKAPIIELRDFAGYRAKACKLRVPEAVVREGEWIAIIGENGAGKSTLLLSLMKLLKVSGDYRLLGELVESSKRSLADDIAFVFQNPELQFVTNSVYEELAHALQIAGASAAESARRVQDALRLFQLPENDGRHPYQLSLGQKRRLSVASATMVEQPVVLLDEPTFGQDARNTFAILERLERLRAGGTTILMVTHDPEIVRRFATAVWRVEHGELKIEQPNSPGEELTPNGPIAVTAT